MLQKESGGFRQKAAFFNFQSFAALCRDAATLDVHVPKMSLLTELEILGAGFLQRWRAYGAGKNVDA